MSQTVEHVPVLFHEALEALNLLPDGIYVDGTFGRGGHSGAVLNLLGPSGRLLAIDKDPEAIECGRRLFGDDGRFEIRQGSFAMLERFARESGIHGRVNGILLDLGVSSPQLDKAERGFSFIGDGRLDMRMDNTSGMSAAEWVADTEESEIAWVFKEYGEERFARRIARAIVKARTEAPILTTARLAGIVSAANPSWEKGKHPATRCFQAIRIHINRELDDLRDCLAQAVDVLAPGGRLAVISFHSLEDRIVKRFIRESERGDDFPPGVPVTREQMNPRLRRIGKAIYPTREEIDANPRARSSVLRVAERLS
jgi:16S rRNA (cytosine1402-N4)-methyltransferase